VDGLLAEQELLVKDLGPRLRGLRLVSGATILPSGSVALLLNPAELVLAASTRAAGPALAAALAEAPVERKRRLLVVEDSVTTRTLERSILEAAGYEVAVAVDGAEGWRLLQESPPDLVIADVEMPRLDGIGLTEAIRASRRFHDLPVILVTALASETDQARGLAAGANAYLVKSAFDQRNLLETVSQLL
jgi:two-component system chemotaxis sensor kinase CheA